MGRKYFELEKLEMEKEIIMELEKSHGNKGQKH